MNMKVKSIWDDIDNVKKIRDIYTKKGNSYLAIENFIEVAKALDLNPILKEVWLLPNDTIIIGRDGSRKVAQRHPEYDYHTYAAFHENDIIDTTTNEIKHTFNLKDRGKLVGAYCVAKRKNSSGNVRVYVDLDEYNQKRNLWNSKPATMIAKVAEVQCLRAAFTELFSGTYSEDEYPTDEEHKAEKKAKFTSKDKLKSTLGVKDDNNSAHVDSGAHASSGPDYDVSDEYADLLTEEGAEVTEVLLQELHQVINQLLLEKSFNNGRLEKMLAHYKVESIEQLDHAQSLDCLEKLRRIPC